MILLSLLFACGESANVETPDLETPAPSGLEGSWVAEIVAHPEAFEQAVRSTREGWIALHKNAWTDALASGGTPAVRAAAELADFHKVLAGLSTDTWRSLGETWERRGTLPADSALPSLLALAARDAGDELAATRWESLPGRVDPAVIARKAAHDALRAGTGDTATFLALVQTPLVDEAVRPAQGGHRLLWDPRVHRSLADAWARVAAAAPSSNPMEQRLFSGRLAPMEESASASFATLGVTLPTTDDADACREAVRGLDRTLDPSKVQLTAAAPPEGQSLLRDLRLVEGVRSRLLVDAGVEALGGNRPRCALAFAEMALDHESPRAVGPLNSPTLFAVLATANLRTGRTREALDALEVLQTPFPEVIGLDETVGDLAVLQGLDRTGDSREN